MRTRVTSIARLPTRMRSVVAMASPALSVVCTENLNSRRGQPATATETGSVRARLPISRPKFSRSRNGQDTTANNRSRCRRRWGHRRTQSHESHGGNAQRGAPPRAIIEEQDRLIAERSGTPAIAVKSIHRSGSKKADEALRSSRYASASDRCASGRSDRLTQVREIPPGAAPHLLHLLHIRRPASQAALCLGRNHD